MKQLIIASLLAISCFAESTLVKLTPPQFDRSTILSQECNTRPVRKNGCYIALEKVGAQTIIHNYGHGSKGWSTAFGTVYEALKLFKERYPDPSQCPDIRVIGAGCIGLITAMELHTNGYPIKGITAEQIYDIASWLAAAEFSADFLTHWKEVDATSIAIHSCKTLQEIEKGRHSYLTSTCVRPISYYCANCYDIGLDLLVEEGLLPSREEVTLDFGDGRILEEHHVYTSYFIDATQVMKELHQQCDRLHIPVEIAEVYSFDQLDERVIFNCSGLGSKQLNHDDNMIASRGHIFSLNEEAGEEHLDYILLSRLIQDGKNKCLLIAPKNCLISSKQSDGTKCYGILGSTGIHDTDMMSEEELEKLDRDEFEKMYERIDQFFNGVCPEIKE